MEGRRRREEGKRSGILRHGQRLAKVSTCEDIK